MHVWPSCEGHACAGRKRRRRQQQHMCTLSLSLPSRSDPPNESSLPPFRPASKISAVTKSSFAPPPYQDGVDECPSRSGRKHGGNEQISTKLWQIVRLGSAGHCLHISPERGAHETLQGHFVRGAIYGGLELHLYSSWNSVIGHRTFPQDLRGIRHFT